MSQVTGRKRKRQAGEDEGVVSRDELDVAVRQALVRGYTSGYAAGIARRDEQPLALVPYGHQFEDETDYVPLEEPKKTKSCVRCMVRKIRCDRSYPCTRCVSDGAECLLAICHYDPCGHGENCYALHTADYLHITIANGREPSIFYHPDTSKSCMPYPVEGLPFAVNKSMKLHNPKGYKGKRPDWMTGLWFPEEMKEEKKKAEALEDKLLH